MVAVGKVGTAVIDPPLRIQLSLGPAPTERNRYRGPLQPAQKMMTSSDSTTTTADRGITERFRVDRPTRQPLEPAAEQKRTDRLSGDQRIVGASFRPWLQRGRVESTDPQRGRPPVFATRQVVSRRRDRGRSPTALVFLGHDHVELDSADSSSALRARERGPAHAHSSD
jgi:hypothetical protein